MITCYRLGACPRQFHPEYYGTPQKSNETIPILLAAAMMLFLFLLGPATLQAADQEPWEPEYQSLLATYVAPGGVRYKQWHQNAEDVQNLNSIAHSIAKQGPLVTSREGKLAYYINAYNIWMLKLIMDSYPVDSVRDIAMFFGVFTGKRIHVAGERMSLNHLEKQIIIPVFEEPRIHFALNCASASCPPLLDEPFTAARLDAQLEQVTRTFLAQPGPHSYQIEEGNYIRVSKIFDWYRSDFDPPGIVRYINKYRSQSLDPAMSVKFFDYDWRLNEAGKKL